MAEKPEDVAAPLNIDGLPTDPPAGRRGQPQHGIGDFLRTPRAAGQRIGVEHPLLGGLINPGRCIALIPR